MLWCYQRFERTTERRISQLMPSVVAVSMALDPTSLEQFEQSEERKMKWKKIARRNAKKAKWRSTTNNHHTPKCHRCRWSDTFHFGHTHTYARAHDRSSIRLDAAVHFRPADDSRKRPKKRNQCNFQRLSFEVEVDTYAMDETEPKQTENQVISLRRRSSFLAFRSLLSTGAHKHFRIGCEARRCESEKLKCLSFVYTFRIENLKSQPPRQHKQIGIDFSCALSFHWIDLARRTAHGEREQ